MIKWLLSLFRRERPGSTVTTTDTHAFPRRQLEHREAYVKILKKCPDCGAPLFHEFCRGCSLDVTEEIER